MGRRVEVRYGTVWYGMVRYGTVGTVPYGTGGSLSGFGIRAHGAGKEVESIWLLDLDVVVTLRFSVLAFR